MADVELFGGSWEDEFLEDYLGGGLEISLWKLPEILHRQPELNVLFTELAILPRIQSVSPI